MVGARVKEEGARKGKRFAMRTASATQQQPICLLFFGDGKRNKEGKIDDGRWLRVVARLYYNGSYGHDEDWDTAADDAVLCRVSSFSTNEDAGPFLSLLQETAASSVVVRQTNGANKNMAHSAIPAFGAAAAPSMGYFNNF